MKDINMSVPELQELLNENRPVFLLDVRPQDQREEWHIPGSAHLDAYRRLNGGDLSVLDEVAPPAGTPVVTVCAAGKTSRIAAQALRGKGLPAYSLEGGMKAWNYAWNTAELSLPETDVKIVQVRRVSKGCLSYVVGSGGEALVVDAALDPDVYLRIAGERGWSVRYAVDTHIHADYLSRTRELAAVTGAQHLFTAGASVNFPFTPLQDQQLLSLGNATVQVLHTPGHTGESASLLVSGGALLTGDTLFTDGVGRPDLKADRQEAARKASQLYDSLQRLLSLPQDPVVLSAHVSRAVPFDGKVIQAPISALRERLGLLTLAKEEFIEATLTRIPPTPPNYLTIAGLNKSGSYTGHVPAELEAGANRCAVA